MARLIIATPCCLFLLASLAVGFQFDGGAKASAPGPLLGLGGQAGGHVSQTEMPKRSEVDIESYVEIVFAPPTSLQARQHGRIVLECATNGRPTAEITWYKDGMPVYPKYGATSTPVHFHPGSISETRSRLEFECISFEDAGRYECVAENGAGRKSVTTDITVVGYESIGCGKGHVLFPKPTITKWVKQLLQPLATEARLPCRAVQKHTTAWFGPANRAITGDGNDYTIMPNGDLVIHKLAARDIGTFKCLVSNDNGRDWAETFVYPFVV